MRLSRRAFGVVLTGVMLAATHAYANDDAHSIANRFAEDSAVKPTPVSDEGGALQRKLEDEERLRADEVEMLERAKAEAAERAQEERRNVADEEASDAAARERAVKEAARIRDAEKRRQAAEQQEADRKAKADAEEQRLVAERAEAERAAKAEADAEAQRHAADKAEAERHEAERAAKAKADAETQRLAAEKAAAERQEAERKAKAVAEAKRAAAEEASREKEIEAAKARIDEAKKADERRRMEAAREDEARRLSEKLTRAREQRAAEDAGEGYSGLGGPVANDEPGHVKVSPKTKAGDAPRPELANHVHRDEPGPSGGSEARATILLVMAPGRTGIRRHQHTGDPIVCSGGQCFIGQGADAPATAMARNRALGPGNTLGRRAGACRHSLACIFRDADVGAETFDLQAIDMRILRHDRRESVRADVDYTCRAVRGRLSCREPVVTGSYRAWIVPERVARAAGPDALTAALEAGLPAADTAGAWR
jgi:hypothetical protein